MSDLLIFLLMMPPFPNILHQAEIGQALLELIKNLDKKTGLAFFSAFTALEDEQFKQKIDKETLTEIKIYLDHWNRAANCMLEWSKELIRTWKELIKEDISADDLLNITINR